MARDVRKQLTSGQAYAAGGVISFDLPRDNVYKELNLGLEVAVSTGVAGALTNLWDRSPWTNIKRIEVIADGKDTIKSYDGGTLLDINHEDFGTYPLSELADSVASRFQGNATSPLYHFLTISFESVGMERPQDTFLDSRRLSSLELRITFGAGLADIFQTVTAPATLDRYFVTPYGHEILDISRESQFSVNQESMTQTAFPSTAATDRQYRLNVGNSYRRLFVSSVDANSRGAVDHITRLILQENGIFNRRNLPAAYLKWLDIRQRGVQGQSLGENPVAFTSRDAAAAPTTTEQFTPGRSGAYTVRIAEDGRASSLLFTGGYSDLSLLVSWADALTTEILRITPTIIVPNVR